MTKRSFIVAMVITIAALVYNPAVESAVSGGGDYLLAPGDIIRITVFDEPALSVEHLTIPASGVISYPLLGRIDTKGYSLANFEQHMTALLLNGYLKHPKVSIAIVQYRPYFVKGDVKQPGRHAYSDGITLGQALTVAGASTDLGDGTTILVARTNGNTVHATEVGLPIRPGDVITVKRDVAAEIEKATSFIYLYGQVNSPGDYQFRGGLTVEKAIAIAGGFTATASDGDIDIHRHLPGQDPAILDDVELNSQVMPGDSIVVGESWF